MEEKGDDSFNKRLLSTCCVPGCVLGSGDIVVNKTGKPLLLWADPQVEMGITVISEGDMCYTEN